MPSTTKDRSSAAKRIRIQRGSTESDNPIRDAASPAGKRLQEAGRAFRLMFRGLGRTRQIGGRNREIMTAQVDADEDQLSLAKSLFAKHPALTAVSAAHGRVRALFEARTLPFPEGGVRLFMLRSTDPAEQAAEVDKFLQEMRNVIADHAAAVSELADQWDDVLRAAHDKLRALFDPADYPTAGTVRLQLRIILEPYNFELPSYYKYVSPTEYAAAKAILSNKFAEAAELQANYVMAALKEAVDGLIDKLNGYQAGEVRRLSKSSVEHVFAALDEFHNKTAPYGILSGSALNAELDKLRKVLSGDTATEATVRLKQADVRASVVSKLGEIKHALFGLTERVPTRNIVR